MKRLVSLALVSLALGGCARSSGVEPGGPARPRPRPADRGGDAEAGFADAVLVGRMTSGTFGPRLVSSGAGRLVTWLTPTGEQRGVYSLLVPADEPPGPAQRIADAPESVRFIEAAPAGADGVSLLVVRRAGHLELLELFQLSATGELRGGPTVVSEASAEILWAELLPTSTGSLLVWAESSRELADLYAIEIASDGPRAQPTRLSRGASAWQVTARGDEIFLGTLEGNPGARRVFLRSLDPAARLRREPLLVGQGFEGGLDLDLAASASSVALTLGKKGAYDSRLERAIIGADGKLTSPLEPLTPPRGEQTLVALFASPASPAIYAVWEEPARRPTRGRALLLGQLDAGGHVAVPRATLFTEGSDPLLPLFASTAEGLVLIAEARRCAIGRACEAPPLERLVVGAREDWARVSAGPLEIRQGTIAPARMVWDLRCDAGGCSALGADGGQEPTVYVLELSKIEGLNPPLRTFADAAPPRVVAQETLAELPVLAALRGRATSSGALLGWLTDFDESIPYEKPTKPAPDGRLAPVRALLATRGVEAEGPRPARLQSEQIVSYRARSLGGLALAPGQKDEAVLAWAALDDGKPQLFLTGVDGAGKKLKQKMHKRPAGEVGDISATWSGAGTWVGWVDGRGERSEVYGALFDEKLELIGKEWRLSEGAVGPTGVSSERLDDGVLVVWTDARGASRAGFSDLHGVVVDAKSGEPQGAPRRLFATELHSHSPSLIPLGARAKTALLGWLEAEPAASGPGRSSLFLAEIDGGGRFVAPPTEVPLEGRARSFSGECDEAECRLVVALEVGERGELWGLVWSGRGAPRMALLSVLDGPAPENAGPLLLGSEVFFVDTGRTSREALLRRLVLEF